eukprot:gene11827-2310_t
MDTSGVFTVEECSGVLVEWAGGARCVAGGGMRLVVGSVLWCLPLGGVLVVRRTVAAVRKHGELLVA